MSATVTLRRPHKFKVVYSVALHGETLRTDLRVLNTDDKPFDFSAALHSYIEVLDVEKAGVRGLQGLDYLDKVGALAQAKFHATGVELLDVVKGGRRGLQGLE